MSTKPIPPIVTIEETVLVFRQAQLDAWVGGDKSLMPYFVDPPAIVANQPRYHFGEMLTLRHFHETEGWFGFAGYALGPQYPGSVRRKAGRGKVEEVIPRDRLTRFRELQASDPSTKLGAGEPDLFLYKQDGTFMFVEVKKGADALSLAQRRTISLILAVLRCPVAIVYLREENQVHAAKVETFDLAPFL